MNIITNNQPRDILDGFTLTEREQAEFDYYDWSNSALVGELEFVRYKGELIDLGDLEWSRTPVFPGWDAYVSDTFFSGILIRWTEDNEQVIMGRYYS